MGVKATSVFQCGWVEEPIPGPPGADAVVYEVQVTPDAWCLNADGTAPFTAAEYPALSLVRIEGATRTDITSDVLNSIVKRNLVRVIADGENVTAFALAGQRVNPAASDGRGYKSLRVEFLDSVVSKNVVASKSCSISQAGVQGATGPFTPPPMQWKDYTTGFKFTDGTDGTPRYVVIHGFAANGKVMAYACKKSHNKIPNNASGTTGTEPGTTPGNEYWDETPGPFTLLSTEVILAVNAFINFLSGNAIRLYDASGANVVGEIMGGSGILAWLGGSQGNPLWAVDVQGMQTLGGRSGQRIELDPSEKAMRIFDSSGNLCGMHSGRSIGSDPVPGSGTNTISEASIASVTKTKSGHTETGNHSQATSYTAAEMGVSIPTGGTTEITVPKMHCEMRTVPGSQVSVPASARCYMEPRVKVYNGTTLVNTFALEGVSHTGGGSKTVDCPARTFYQSGAITRVVLEMMCDVVNTAGLPGEFKWVPATPSDKLRAAFKIKRYRCEFGSDGMVISFDNNNYFYIRHDGSKLVGKFVSEGTTIFTTENNNQ